MPMNRSGERHSIAVLGRAVQLNAIVLERYTAGETNHVGQVLGGIADKAVQRLAEQVGTRNCNAKQVIGLRRGRYLPLISAE